MLPVTVTVGPLDSADPDGIATAQTAAGAGALDIDGALATDGVATLDEARRLLVTSSGDDTGITFRITGTNSDGNPIQETLTGADTAAVYTVQDFKTVSEVYASGATDGDVEVGTNDVGSSRWVVCNYQIAPANISMSVVVDGTVNYTIEYTYDNVNSNQNTMGGANGNYPAVPTVWAHSTLAAQTTSKDGFFAYPILAWRATLNSGSGSITATGVSAGINN
jgi:hypothetical protein